MDFKQIILWKSLPLRVLSLVLMFLIILFVLFVLFDWVIMPLMIRHGRECTVPTVVGMSLEDARDFLKMSKLKIEVISEEVNAQRPVGTVLIQNPETGKIVKKGRKVKVIISKGGENVEIPDLAGISLRQAGLTLSQKGLEVGDINWVISDSLPENVIVSTIPLAGSIVPERMSVNLLVSQGKLYDVVMMPKLIGKNLEQAQRIADSLKLEIEKIKYLYREDLLPGTVIYQTPQSGTKLRAWSSITLEVSSTE